jgi:hypothetical protein
MSLEDGSFRAHLALTTYDKYSIMYTKRAEGIGIWGKESAMIGEEAIQKARKPEAANWSNNQRRPHAEEGRLLTRS